jgi:hypothetical protein
MLGANDKRTFGLLACWQIGSAKKILMMPRFTTIAAHYRQHSSGEYGVSVFFTRVFAYLGCKDGLTISIR